MGRYATQQTSRKIEANDCTRLIQVIEAIRIPRTRAGRPRVRPLHLIADKGYSTNKIRLYLRRRRIPHTIPERRDQLAVRARRGWRRCGFDKEIYRRRNVVERCFGQLKRFRGLATRYEKLAAHYRSVVTIASLILWLNQDPQNRPGPRTPWIFRDASRHREQLLRPGHHGDTYAT